MNYIFKTWNFLKKKERKKFLIIILFFIILSILEVLSIASVIPFVTAIFSPDTLSSVEYLAPYIAILQNNQSFILYSFCIIFLLIFISKIIFTIISYKFIYKFIFNFKASISRRILSKLFHQNYLFFLKNSQGKLTGYLLWEVQIISETYLLSLMVLISEIIIAFAILCLVISVGKLQGIFVIFPILFIAVLIIKKINKIIKDWSEKRVIIAAKKSDLVHRIFLGIRDIFFSKNGNYIIDNFYSLSKQQSDIDAGNFYLQTIPRAILETFGIIILIVFIIFLKIINLSSTDILANLTFYFAVAYRIMPSFNKILVQYQRLKYSKNSIDNLSNIIKLPNQRIISSNTNEVLQIKKIKLENYNFAYNKTKILNNINLEIKKGEVVGIYGQSGSGKSTLLNIICLLLASDDGKYFFNDKIITSHLDTKKIQDIITFISQDTFLIDDTIKNNIILNESEEFDYNKFQYSLNFSRAIDFVRNLENGTDYNLGSNSRRISTGQKQRIALARAIYNLKQVLILDEATNALDEKIENEIFENVNSLKGKITILIVSHNKKNLSFCDKIYQLESGNIKLINQKNI